MLKNAQDRSVKRVKGGHYVATHGQTTPEPPYAHANRGYSTDGEESHAYSERTISEYTVSTTKKKPSEIFSTYTKNLNTIKNNL